MTPLSKLVALAPAIGAMHHPSARDMQQKLNEIIDELRREYPEGGHFRAWTAVTIALTNVRPDWLGSGYTSAKDDAVAAIHELAKVARDSQQCSLAWAAVVCALDEVRPKWQRATGGTMADDAVAAIRSMAAQCSARPPATDTRPTGAPPLRQAQIGALSYAIGYLEARDRSAVALELSTLHAWLVANAPRT